MVAARFHSEVVDALVNGAVEALIAAGAPGPIEVVRVPGAWEIPLAVDAALARPTVDGVVALGCLVRGGTAHFELLAEESTRGVARAMERHGKPVGHGILACENLEQAYARSVAGAANKGYEAAGAVIELATTLRSLRGAAAVVG